MPEPQEQKRPWEKFKAPVPTAGPWDKYQGAGTKKATPAPKVEAAPPTTKPEAKTPQDEGPFGLQENLRSVMGFDPKGGFTDDIKQIWSGLKEEFAHPMVSSELLARGLWDTQESVAQKGISRMKQPGVMNKVTGAVQYLESGIPMAGPILSQAGERAEKHDYAGMFGAMAPLFMGKVLDRVVKSPESLKAVQTHTKVVDGHIKAAADIAQKTGSDVEAATTTAHQITQHPVINSLLHARAVEDAYEDTVGIKIGNMVDKAVKSAEGEVKAHAEHLSSNIPDKIDAAEESALIVKEFKDVVKTPDKAHPVLIQMVKDAAPDPKNPMPKMWAWDKVRQFRSSVGRSISKVDGPQKVVLTRVYLDLTKKLRGMAEKHGLTESFDHYNELEKKIHSTFSDLIDDIRGNRRGAEVAKALNKDTSYTSRALASLSKYGLDSKQVLRYMKNATKIQKLRGKNFGTIFRWAYGNPYGAVATIGLKVAGAGYPVAMGVGASVGIAATYLTRTARALRLAPEVLEGMLTDEVWPGKKSLKKPTTPAEEAPRLSAPETPPQPPAPSGEETETEMARRLRGSGAKEPMSDQVEAARAKLAADKEAARVEWEKKQQAAREGKAPEVKKVEPEQHGTGKLAEQAKARERVAKLRKAKGPTAAGGGGLEVSGGDVAGKAQFAKENAEAKARAQSAHFDVSTLQIPELEEYVRGKYPEEFKSLLKQRKVGAIPDTEWKAALEYLTLNGLEE